MTFGSASRAFVAVLLWGASFVATKIALGEASPLTVIVLRFGIGVAVIALMFASAFNWAPFTAASKRMIGRYPPAVLIGYTMAIGWLMMLPLCALEGGWRSIGHLSQAGWTSIPFLGVGCSGFAYVFWYDAPGAAWRRRSRSRAHRRRARASFPRAQPPRSPPLAATAGRRPSSTRRPGDTPRC
jgi:drug/metabolite transporter (DMT)-like permease